MNSLPFKHEQIVRARATFHLYRTSFLLSGEEVRRWCNGMFSNNIRSLKIGKGNRSAICNPKGHVHGLLDIYCIDDQKFLVVLDGLDQDAFEKKFAPFMMLDDIDLDELQTDLLSIQGPESSQALAELDISISDERDIQEYDWGFILRKDRFGSRRETHGFEIISTQLPKLLVAVQKNNTVYTEEDFEHHRILTLQAKFPEDIGERAFIHELGINEECCSFNKGCYVGQEIINRMDVKGLVNKSLRLYHGESPFPIGETVTFNDKKAGEVRSTCMFDNTHYALIMVRKAAWGSDLTYSRGVAKECPPFA